MPALIRRESMLEFERDRHLDIDRTIKGHHTLLTKDYKGTTLIPLQTAPAPPVYKEHPVRKHLPDGLTQEEQRQPLDLLKTRFSDPERTSPPRPHSKQDFYERHSSRKAPSRLANLILPSNYGEVMEHLIFRSAFPEDDNWDFLMYEEKINSIL